MKVTLETGDRLELRGIPQGRGLVFGFIVCLAIIVVAAIFAYILYTRSGSIWSAAGPGVGVILGLFILACLTLVSFQRERLTLDKVTQTAEHETWSLLVGTRKCKTYPFDKIHAVALEMSLQSPGGGKGFPIEVTKARLLITKPRRAIDLDEAQSGATASVEALAKSIAEFLSVPLKTMGSHDEPPSDRSRSRD